MPSSVSRTITDVELYRQSIRPANVEFLVTGRGRFSGKVVKIDLHRLWTQRLEENLPRVWRLAVPVARSAIWFSLAPGPAIYADGDELRETDIGLLQSGTIVWQRPTGAMQMGSMSLPSEDMAELSIALTGRDLTPRRGTLPMHGSPPALERLRRLHGAAAHLADTAPEIITNAEAARGLEQTLIDAMFCCLAQGEVQEDAASQRRHGTIARRFTALAAENPEEPLYLTEVCTALGVNQRTLHQVCTEQLGVSPARYLLLRRMHLARHALIAAVPGSATVTETATRYGFWELGRFAVVYKNMFAESPSATLRRPRG